MNLKENGTDLKLETFKDSIEKKNKRETKFLYIKFVLIFFISHMLRTALQPTETISHKQPELKENYLRIKLKAESFISKEVKRVNLFHKIKHLEITNVTLVQKHNDQYELDIETKNISLILLNQDGWQIVPQRTILKHPKRKTYEILL